MTVRPGDAPSPYALSDDEPAAAQILEFLSDICDEFTFMRLVEAGVPEAASCLELGAGNGSVAAWLADEVGPAGLVVATDVRPQYVKPHPLVTVIEHDIVNDLLPAGHFDLVHARLLFAHLPQRHEVLRRVAAALQPGGVLVVEEFGELGGGEVLRSPDPAAVELYDRYQEALLDVLRSQGSDTRWSVDVYRAMEAVGLVEVDTAAYARTWRGGTPGCQLPIAVSTELHDELVGRGITSGELEQLRAVLADRRTVVTGNLLWSTIGRWP